MQYLCIRTYIYIHIDTYVTIKKKCYQFESEGTWEGLGEGQLGEAEGRKEKRVNDVIPILIKIL